MAGKRKTGDAAGKTPPDEARGDWSKIEQVLKRLWKQGIIDSNTSLREAKSAPGVNLGVLTDDQFRNRWYPLKKELREGTAAAPMPNSK